MYKEEIKLLILMAERKSSSILTYITSLMRLKMTIRNLKGASLRILDF